MNSKKVLFVVTSFGLIEATGKQTGIWLEELSTPYYALLDQGTVITLASPKGGKAPIDPRSLLPQSSTDSVKRFLSDLAAMDKLEHTLPLSRVRADHYDAVFYPGGHGPMWDLPEDASSIALINDFYQQGKPVALVCHGPAALKNVMDANGQPFIKGKKVTGYSNSEEVTGHSTDMVPFMLEDVLKEKGGLYSKGPDWGPYVVTEGLLITGQNPASAAGVAEELITSLSLPE